MIEINLLPERFKKRRRASQAEILQIPKELIIGLVIGLFGILILIHFVLLIWALGVKMNYVSLDKDWNKILPQKRVIDSLKQEISSIEGKLNSIAILKSRKKILWAKKLNIISDSMVRGVWLTKFYFGENILKIEGSAVSKKGEEMINVSEFATNLKANKEFYSDVLTLDIISLQRRSIKSIEVVDFLLTITVKE